MSNLLGTVGNVVTGVVGGVVGLVVGSPNPPATTPSQPLSPGTKVSFSSGPYQNVAATVTAITYQADGVTPAQTVVQVNTPNGGTVQAVNASLNMTVSS